MAHRFEPNPFFSDDVMRATTEKFQALLSIKCGEHDQTARLIHADGKLSFETCCENLDRQLREAMDKSA